MLVAPLPKLSLVALPPDSAATASPYHPRTPSSRLHSMEEMQAWLARVVFTEVMTDGKISVLPTEFPVNFLHRLSSRASISTI